MPLARVSDPCRPSYPSLAMVTREVAFSARHKNPLDKQDVPRNARAHPEWESNRDAL
jgi:hypothetical protein